MTKEHFVGALKRKVDKFGSLIEFHTLEEQAEIPSDGNRIYRQRADRINKQSTFTFRGSIFGLYLRDISDEEYTALGLVKGQVSGKISTLMQYFIDENMSTDFKEYHLDKLVFVDTFGHVDDYNIIKVVPYAFWENEQLGLYIYLDTYK